MPQPANDFKSPITREWYNKAETFKPKPGVDYSWVFDYAKVRFNWACENGRYIDEKIVNLFRFNLAIAAGMGAVFSFLVSQDITLCRVSHWLLGLSILSLLISGTSLLGAFDPRDHLYPVEEETALLLIDRFNIDQDSRANMSLALNASTELERHSANDKGKYLRVAVLSSSLCVILFILGLFSLLL